MGQGVRTAVVVDDDPQIRIMLRAALEATGFVVLEAATGSEAVDLVREHDPDLITLDLVLPGFDGVEVCRRIRELTDAYIVMITASGDEADRLVGLATGADDYVTKPFSPREVQARVTAMFRRPRRVARNEPAADHGPAAVPGPGNFQGSGGSPRPGSGPGTGTAGGTADGGVQRSYLNPAPPVGTNPLSSIPRPRSGEGRHSYPGPVGAGVPDVPPWSAQDEPETGIVRHGRLVIDLEGRSATYAGTELPLTKIEFDLLATMAGNPRRVWRRETLLNIVWGGQWSDHHVVEVHIGNLRRKLADVAGAGVPVIKTVRGIGYRMAPLDPSQSGGQHSGMPAGY